MRVLMLTDQWNRLGGMEGVTVEIAKGLIALGHDITIVSQLDSGPTEQDGIVALGLAPRNRYILSPYMRFLWRPVIARCVEEHAASVDIVLVCHIRLLESTLSGLSRIGKRRPRCIVWTHGSEVWGGEGRKYRRPLSKADKVVGVSRFTVSQLCEFVPENRLVVIPNMVDTDVFTPAADSTEIRKNNILIVSRLSPAERSKGHLVLFDALSILRQDYDLECSLTVVGDGEDRLALEAIARSLPEAQSIEFLGRVSLPTLISCYQKCSVFALPSCVDKDDRSRWTGEGFGLVYIEAAACGRPVVASCEGGAPETIVDGETGFLVDPRSSQSVASAIARLMCDSPLATRFGQQGRRWVEDNFAIENFLQRLSDLVNHS